MDHEWIMKERISLGKTASLVPQFAGSLNLPNSHGACCREYRALELRALSVLVSGQRLTVRDPSVVVTYEGKRQLAFIS